MTSSKPASVAYAETFVTEPPAFEAARRRGEELGATPIGAGGGALLRVLAAATGATSVCEIGTGAGCSGAWLLDGLGEDGTLTTIDLEAEQAVAARATFRDAGFPHQRARTITGNALDVLPRMNDGAYDIVLVDADKENYPAYVDHALRLLRPGGLLVLDNMLWHDKVADPAARDATTTTLRDLGKELRDREDLVSALVPLGDGIFLAVKRG